MKFLKMSFPALSLIALLIAGTALIELLGSAGTMRVATEALIRLVFAVGLYVFAGNSGIVSFGHMAFVAIAAYATTWQTCCAMLKPITMPGLPSFLKDQTYPLLSSALTSVALAGAVAFVSGLVLMRLASLSASIATLALLFIVNTVYSNWVSVTMGNSTVVGLPVYVTLELALLAAIAAIIVAYLYQVSAWGLMLRATREDEVAAKASGVSLYWPRVIAFTLSGVIASCAGVLFAHFTGTVSISSFFLSHTFLIVAMIVVGGMRSLAGTVVGVTVLSIVIEIFRRVEAGISVGSLELAIPPGSQEMILALSMLVILVFRKDGIMAGREITFPLWRRNEPTSAAGAGEAPSSLTAYPSKNGDRK
jgi:branched-chain amino acid transport system permease protein